MLRKFVSPLLSDAVEKIIEKASPDGQTKERLTKSFNTGRKVGSRVPGPSDLEDIVIPDCYPKVEDK